MWNFFLLMVLFSDGKLVQVAEPMPGTTFQTMEVCYSAAAKLAGTRMPPGWKAVPVCVEAP